MKYTDRIQIQFSIWIENLSTKNVRHSFSTLKGKIAAVFKYLCFTSNPFPEIQGLRSNSKSVQSLWGLWQQTSSYNKERNPINCTIPWQVFLFQYRIPDKTVSLHSHCPRKSSSVRSVTGLYAWEVGSDVLIILRLLWNTRMRSPPGP